MTHPNSKETDICPNHTPLHAVGEGEIDSTRSEPMPMGFIAWGNWAGEDNGSPENLSQEFDSRDAFLTRLDWDKAEEVSISYEWEVLNSYLEFLESHLVETLRDWEQTIDQEAQKIDDEYERDDFYDFHSDEYYQRLSFRGILMNSFFLASFALFENQLMRICERAQRNSGSPFSVRDLGSSSPTNRAKKYLRKLGVAFPAETPEWQEITDFRSIRNKIMHAGGVVTCQDPVAAFAKEKQIVIHRGGNSNLELTRPFCDDALLSFRLFLLEVHRSYVLWLNDNK